MVGTAPRHQIGACDQLHNGNRGIVSELSSMVFFGDPGDPFRCPNHTQGALLRGDPYSGKRPPKAYRFWLPLLGTFTGAKLDEPRQFHTADIQQIVGLWSFSFNNDGQKKFKNVTNLPTVPVHQQLITLGS